MCSQQSAVPHVPKHETTVNEMLFRAQRLCEQHAAGRRKIHALPTGSLHFDLSTGFMGVPRGEMLELYGSDAVGKTALALSIARHAQHLLGCAVYLDMDRNITPSILGTNRVDEGTFLLCRPKDGDEAFSFLRKFVRARVPLVVVDSVGAFQSSRSVKSDYGVYLKGEHSRLMDEVSAAIVAERRGTPEDTTVVFVNHIFNDPKDRFRPYGVLGGRNFRRRMAMNIHLHHGRHIGKHGNVYGFQPKFEIVRNTASPALCKGHFSVYWGEGVSTTADLVELGMSSGVVKVAGPWYEFEGVNLGKGFLAVKRMLNEDKKLRHRVYDSVMARLAGQVSGNGEKEECDGNR